MHHQVRNRQLVTALQLVGQRIAAAREKRLIGRAEIDQICRVRHDWTEAGRFAQLVPARDILGLQRRRMPLPLILRSVAPEQTNFLRGYSPYFSSFFFI